MTTRPDRSRADRPGRPVLLAALAGVALGMAWRSDTAAPLALASVACLTASLRGATPGRRAALAWLAGSLASGLGAGQAAADGLSAYFQLQGAPLLLAWLGVHQVLGTLPFVAFALLAGGVERRAPLLAFIDVGAAWVVGEWVRELLFPGAWLSLASALAPWPSALQTAAELGASSVSFGVAGFGLLIQRVLTGPDRNRSIRAALAIASLLVVHSAWSVDRARASARLEPAGADPDARGGLAIALVQSGVDARERSELPDDAQALDRLIEVSSPAARGADLVVWPEGAVRGVWPANASLLDRARLARLGARHVLLGAPWVARPLQGEPLSVAAVLLDANGRIEARHRKTRLVPIAEAPAAGPIGRVAASAAGYSPAGEVSPLTLDATRLGVSLCYEILFDSVARAQVGAGADLLLHLSNESWLGSSGQGQRQMLAASVLRAVETRRSVLRATTTGSTAAIDPSGRIVAELPPRASGVLRLDVDPKREDAPSTPRARSSLFARIGPWPLASFCFAWTALRRVARRRGGAAPGVDSDDARRPA